MASIRKRGDVWQARVRRYGYPDEVKSFPNKTDAEAWVRSIESEMDRGQYISRTDGGGVFPAGQNIYAESQEALGSTPAV